MKTNNVKKIIVTGTSRGIGFDLVKRYAKEGHQVLALSRNATPIQTLGLANVDSFSFDITQASDRKKVSDFVKKQWDGELNILINNAGMLINKPFENLTSADFEAVYRVNVFGVAAMVQEVLPFMGASSHVVTISSMGGVQGSMKFPGLAAYSSSKGAVITLSELLAEEYKDRGIAFNVLALGAVQTEMLAEAFPGYQALLTASQMASYIYDFSLMGNTFYNGKTLEVSSSTP